MYIFQLSFFLLDFKGVFLCGFVDFQTSFDVLTFLLPGLFTLFGATDDAPPPRPVIKHRLDLCDVMCSRRLAGRQKFGEKFWECVRPKRRRFPALFVQ